jgi:hypothetical protein
VKLSSKGMKRLKKKRKLKALAVARVRGPIGRTATIKKKLTLKAPARPKKKRRAPTGGPTPGPGTPGAGNSWVARKGSSGAYDDFKFTLDGGNINITKTTLVFVTCFENGDNYESASSFELFGHNGPWELGKEDTFAGRGRATNRLVSSGERSITYKLSSARSGDRITGKIGMSFFDSRYDPFTNKITFINCFGSENYEAIPG